MSKIKWFWLAFGIPLLTGAGYYGYQLKYVITDRNDFIGIGIVTGFCLLFGLFALFTAFCEGWLLKKLYGEFSNRNPWGR